MEAIKEYDVALSIAPSNIKYIIHKGISYQHINQYEFSIVVFLKALYIENTNKKALFNLANSYIQMGEFYKAIDFFNALINNFDDK